MTLIKCTECQSQVSTKAAICPNCGAPVVVPVASALSSFGGWIAVALAVIVGLIALWSSNDAPPTTAPASAPSKPPAIEKIPVDFTRRLETEASALVCPLSALFEQREGRGIRAAMKSRESIFGRKEEAERAGCDEWQEGQPVYLSEDEIHRAIKLQAEHMCGMLEFRSGLAFSCQLRNSADAKSYPPRGVIPLPDPAIGLSAPPLPQPQTQAQPAELILPNRYGLSTSPVPAQDEPASAPPEEAASAPDGATR